MISFFYYLGKNDRINLTKSISFFVNRTVFKDNVKLIELIINICYN